MARCSDERKHLPQEGNRKQSPVPTSVPPERLYELYYSHCQRCDKKHIKENTDVRVLPCLHVVCSDCFVHLMNEALVLSNIPSTVDGRFGSIPYRFPRRFVCPACNFPQYFHSEGLSGYPSAPPWKDSVLNGRGISNSFASVLRQQEFEQIKDKHSTKYEPEWDFMFLYTFGQHGTEEGHFTSITGMAVYEPEGKSPIVVVSDSCLNRITIYKVDGQFVRCFDAGESIRDVAVRENGNIVTTVAGRTFAIAQYDQKGTRLENQFCQIIFKGSGDNTVVRGRLISSEPFGLAIDSGGLYTVTFLKADAVCRFDGPDPYHLSSFGNPGCGKIKFNAPYYITKNISDESVISDTGNHRVKIHNQTNALMRVQIGKLGSNLGEFFYPHGVFAVDDGYIYVADTGNYRVQVFDTDGAFVSCPIADTWQYGENVKPINVCVLKDGRVLVAMQGKRYCQIHVYCSRARPYVQASDTKCFNWFCSLCCCGSHADYEKLN